MASSNCDPSRNRARTSSPMPCGSCSTSAASDCPRLHHQEETGLHGGFVPPLHMQISRTSHPTWWSAVSMAPVIDGSASIGNRATAGPSPPPGSPTDEARLEQLHAGHETRDVPCHGTHGVEAGRERPDAVERNAAPGGLEARGAAAGGGDADRTARVAAVGDVRLARGDGDCRSARRAARDESRIERVDRCPEPRVHARDAERQLVKVGAPDDARRCGRAPRPGTRHRARPATHAWPPRGSRRSSARPACRSGPSRPGGCRTRTCRIGW